MDLYWHPYRYYPYEFDLARREIEALISPRAVRAIQGGLRLSSPQRPEAAERLAYFAAEGPNSKPLLQARLERVNGNGPNRQSTRYSAHGLHEYKGKFNPQVPKAILNILGVPQGSRVLDPFCGSGTALVEAAHLGMQATGTDINPLAVFIANAKIASLRTDPDKLRSAAKAVIGMRPALKPSGDKREAYLASWFKPGILEKIERTRLAISELEPTVAQILAACASDLLREYSEQDPMDLRIRRRKTPLPEKPFADALVEIVERFAFRMERAREVLREIGIGQALLMDSRNLSAAAIGEGPFDCALTSPPYATALPYIDTQRLSLVWLGLVPPEEILPLEARLIGSRESRGAERRNLSAVLEANAERLPDAQVTYCAELAAAVGESDGFRRRAVPGLLYRYFAGMAASFRGVRSVMRDGAPYALVVGGNHTVLGGRRFDIDTPNHLAALAEATGWRIREIIPLQTYQRYGLHMNNAVAKEAMVILEAA